ncbi:hypothetical protein BH24ACT15_BH24ACT15_32140 [soil metagenome]
MVDQGIRKSNHRIGSRDTSVVQWAATEALDVVARRPQRMDDSVIAAQPCCECAARRHDQRRVGSIRR